MPKVTVYVATYEMTRCYGGSEEGGWWYNAGTLVNVVKVRGYKGQVMAKAGRVVDRMRQEWPTTNRRDSVLGGEDYSTWIERSEPAEFFPTERPYYD